MMYGMHEHIKSKSYVSTRTALGAAIAMVVEDPRTMISANSAGMQVLRVGTRAQSDWSPWGKGARSSPSASVGTGPSCGAQGCKSLRSRCPQHLNLKEPT